MDGLVGDKCSGIEIGERLAFYGMSANLVTYLTHVLHEGTAVSAKNVNNWIGTTFLAPLLGAFLADAYWGRFWTIFIFSTVYLVVRNAASSTGIMMERS
jgi:peptide/histidine transporter 3/4